MNLASIFEGTGSGPRLVSTVWAPATFVHQGKVKQEVIPEDETRTKRV